MSFLNPLAFYFLLAIPVVILMYLLKLRRLEHVIPSTLLWRKSLEDLTANAPFQRLRKNFLLFLQILVLALLAMALVRPFTQIQGFEGQNIILLMDRSASMQAKDVSPSRIEKAKAIALEMVDDLSVGDKMMVIAFDSSARVLSNFTDDKSSLRRVIRAVAPCDSVTRLSEAVSIARGVARNNKNVEAFVTSDGNIQDLDTIGEVPFPIHYIAVGAKENNVAITGMDVRPRFERRDEVEVFVRVENFRPSPLETTLSLYHNDSLLDAKEVSIEPHEAATSVFTCARGAGGVIRSELDERDDLALDNVAWKVLHAERTINVLLVGKGNFYLEKALLLNPMVALFRVAREQFDPRMRADLVIFDNCSAEIPGHGNFVFINALPALGEIAKSGELKSPVVIDWQNDHPALSNLNLSNLHILRALELQIPSWATPIVEAAGGPLIVDLSQPRRKLLIVGFDILDSDWPLRISFPLFFANVTNWMPGERARLEEVNLCVGSALSIHFAPEFESLEILDPRGSSSKISGEPGRFYSYSNTDRIGVYRAKWFGKAPKDSSRKEDSNEAEDIFAVNLLSPQESRLGPAETMPLAGKEIVALRRSVRSNQEIWHIFALLALAVLMVEWFIYCRRAWL